MRSANTAPLVALRGISRIQRWQRRCRALKNIDLQIEAGDCVAIVGASGSGKSSMVNLLCGIDIRAGRRALARTNHGSHPARLDALEAQQYRHRIPGIQPDPDSDGAGECRTRAARPGPGRRTASNARRDVVLGQVGLEPRLHHLVTKVSGSERQRVAIARAIVNEPKLLLADGADRDLDGSSARRM